ncbi:Protein grainyhead [Lucilia cuprina]|nr:Protein grainyhead [Lucilia cuprina]
MRVRSFTTPDRSRLHEAINSKCRQAGCMGWLVGWLSDCGSISIFTVNLHSTHTHTYISHVQMASNSPGVITAKNNLNICIRKFCNKHSSRGVGVAQIEKHTKYFVQKKSIKEIMIAGALKALEIFNDKLTREAAGQSLKLTKEKSEKEANNNCWHVICSISSICSKQPFFRLLPFRNDEAILNTLVGAERKTRDEERRAAKRKMTATGRKKLDELYHPVTDRSEFYTMQDLTKPPVLFSPADDLDKVRFPMHSNSTTSTLSTTTSSTTSVIIQPSNHTTTTTNTTSPQHLTSLTTQYHDVYHNNNNTFGNSSQGFYGHESDGAPDLKGASPFLLHGQKVATPTLKFHNHFPPDMQTDKKDHILDQGLAMGEFGPPLKRGRMTPPTSERVMLYVRQENEDVYTPLHVVPPTTIGLLNAIENKYKISTTSINNIYRTNKKGITAKIDDDMISYYCNEDIFLLEVQQLEEELYDITLTELPNH